MVKALCFKSVGVETADVNPGNIIFNIKDTNLNVLVAAL